jgi:thymidylate synthase
MKFNTVDEAYKTLCEMLVNAPSVGNTRELNNMKIEIADVSDSIVSVRNTSLTYLLGEFLWYFNGSQSMEYISKYSTFWKHISDDGVTSNSAYGYLLMHKHGFNQIEKIIELLTVDPNSRRAVININVPNVRVIETKDEPCTIALQFLNRGGKLHCTAIMRSNDIWFGTPYDWAFFIELQKVIADRLGLGYGTYTHFATSFHAYERNMVDIQAIAEADIEALKAKIIFDRNRFHKEKEELFAQTVNAESKEAKCILENSGIIRIIGENN